MQEEIKHFGRRSKLEIACDILKVISEGAKRPTRIMLKSNLTWPLTIAYLEVLLRYRMIALENIGKRRVYRLAPKGAALLEIYTRLLEASGELQLDKISLKMVSKAMSTRRVVVEKGALVDSVRKLLEKSGHSSSTTPPKSVSGARHTFDLVMYDKEGVRTGYLIKESVVVVDVIRAFVMQTDCEIHVCIICRGNPQKEASDLAKGYGIKLIRYGVLAGPNPAEIA